MIPDRQYKLWDQPLLTTAVKLLLEDAKGQAVDLRDRLLVLPTRQTGRRFREALALEMGQRGGALFPHMTITPRHPVLPTDDAAQEFAYLWQ